MIETNFNVASETSRYRAVPYVAGFVYALSFQKYSVRDALDQSTGWQGILEALCVFVACSLMFVWGRNVQKTMRVHPAVSWLCAYGVLALVSSVYSFSPLLSTAKAVVFGAAILMALLVSRMGCATEFLAGVYWSFFASTAAGLLAALALPGTFKLMQVDPYSGRTQLHLWATHPNQLAETSALLVLLAFLLPIKSRWFAQLFFVAVNVFSGEKTSTVALVLTLPIMLFSSIEGTRRRISVATVAIMGCATLLALLFVGAFGSSPEALASRGLTAMYGNQVYNEVGQLDGRTEVWKRALSLSSECTILGFGFEGARAYIIKTVSWAGQAHNGFIQTMLNAGIPGACALCISMMYAVYASVLNSGIWNARFAAVVLYLLILAATGPVFDTSVYLTDVLVILILYVSLGEQSREKSTPTMQHSVLMEV